jgi:hypothetical protein
VAARHLLLSGIISNSKEYLAKWSERPIFGLNARACGTKKWVIRMIGLANLGYNMNRAILAS